LSGVYARAESNFVSGAAMTVATEVTSSAVTINGVVTDTFSTSFDTSLTRKSVVNAINAIATQTGVVATDTGDDTLGVTLTAADGRNIELASGFTLSTGLKAATTYVGSYSLFTLDGRDINIGQSTGTVGVLPATVERNSGLQVGTYKADTAMYTTANRTSTTAAPLSTTAGLLNSNSLIINGVAIGASLSTDDTSTWEGIDAAGVDVVGGTSTTRASSAIAIAAAINRVSNQTGVTATAAENVLRGTGFVASTAAATSLGVFLNGVTFQVAATTVDQTIDRFNEFRDQTGVVASRFGDGMQLVAKDGRTITIASDASASDQLGLTGVTIGANVVPSAGLLPQPSTAASIYLLIKHLKSKLDLKVTPT
jgi:flagellin